MALVDIPLSSTPDWTVELFRDVNQNEPVYVEISAGFPPPGVPVTSTVGLNLRFIGILDIYTLQIDEDLGSFRCRSLAAPLVDTQITTLVQNMTSVDFVNYYAGVLKLNPVIALANAPVMVGSVASNDQVGAILNQRVWDIMKQLAQIDDVDLWCDGTNLYYASQALVNTTTVDLKYGRDLFSLSMTHSPQGNKNVRVDVRSYKEGNSNLNARSSADESRRRIHKGRGDEELRFKSHLWDGQSSRHHRRPERPRSNGAVSDRRRIFRVGSSSRPTAPGLRFTGAAIPTARRLSASASLWRYGGSSAVSSTW